MVEQVYIQCFLLWKRKLVLGPAILGRMKEWETKATGRLFRFKKKEDENITGYCQWNLTTLKHAFTWRSTKWWQTSKSLGMKHYPYNHIRLKHLWGWHNRGCVRGKVASEWAGKEEWRSKRKRCQTTDDRRELITFALQSVKHSTMHRSRRGQKEAENRQERPKSCGAS